MCGFHHPTTNDYADDDKVLFSPENLTPAEYRSFYYSTSSPGGYDLVYESPDEDHNDDAGASVIKARIASHPRYTRLLQAYIDCQKVFEICRIDRFETLMCFLLCLIPIRVAWIRTDETSKLALTFSCDDMSVSLT